jgi:Zn-dependent peptidase ImmA (M78 family)
MMYDPGADVAKRYPHVTVRWKPLGGVPAIAAPSCDLILIERNLPAIERRCALAHEVAHLDLAHGAPICEGKEERAADLLAARRLISTEELADVLRWALGAEEVADALNVTLHIARTRVRNLTDDEKQWIERRLVGVERDIA